MQVGNNFNTQSFCAYRVGRDDDHKREIAKQISTFSSNENIQNNLIDTINDTVALLNKKTTSSGYLNFKIDDPKKTRDAFVTVGIYKENKSGSYSLGYGFNEPGCRICDDNGQQYPAQTLIEEIRELLYDYADKFIVQEELKKAIADKRSADTDRIFSMLA